MELEQFSDELRDAASTGNEQYIKELEVVAHNENNPRFYSTLAWWLYEMPPKGGEKFINPEAADKYFKLAHEGFLRLAKEESDPDAMSILSDMYAWGKGVDVDVQKSKHWLDQCYLIKTGLTFNEWKKSQNEQV